MFSMTACSKNEDNNINKKSNTELSSEEISNEKTSSEKEDVAILKSFDDYKDYVDENIESYKKIYDKHGIKYTLSPDGSMIMNTETEESKFGKKYYKKFGVSIGANTQSKKCNIFSTIFLTNSINDEFSKDDKNILLAFDLLKLEDNSYTLDSFLEEINNEFNSMELEKDSKVIKDSQNIKIFIEKYNDIAKLFILTNKEGKVEYGDINPVEFKTYEEYKKLMKTTNLDIEKEEKKTNDVIEGYSHFQEDGMEVLDVPSTYAIREDGREEIDEYSYGIENAQNLDAQTGDFNIEIVMSYKGQKKNLSLAVEKVCRFLKEKFNLSYNQKDIENYLISNVELTNFVRGLDNNEFIENAMEEAYNSRRFPKSGIPFEGMDSVLGSNYEYSNDDEDNSEVGYDVSFVVTIPAIVEGESKR